MARTAITATALSTNGSIDVKAAGVYQAADATNGMSLKAGRDGHGFIHVKNSDAAAHDVTIKGGSPLWDHVQWPDLKITVPAGGERFIGPLASHKYKQTNGEVWVDFSAATGMTVAQFKVPVGAIVR